MIRTAEQIILDQAYQEYLENEPTGKLTEAEFKDQHKIKGTLPFLYHSKKYREVMKRVVKAIFDGDIHDANETEINF